MNRTIAVVSLLLAFAARAEDPKDSRDPIDPAQAGLTATVPGERGVMNEPQSIGVLTREDIKRNEGVFIDDVINLIPGVRFETRTVQGGQRITIRGYGNGTNFNGSGFKAYIDGVPITDGEGVTMMDDIDFSTLRRVDVIKGPSSSLYGQGIAGVVNFHTLRPEPGTSRLSQEVIGGSQSLLRTNTRYEYGADNANFVMNYGHQHSDGYRVHSESNKDFILMSAEYRPSAKQSLIGYAAYNHSFDQLAGQLTEDQFFTNQNVAEAAYVANNGHVAIDSARLGITHKYAFADWIANTTTAFANAYQLNQPFAVGLTDNMAMGGGGRTQFDVRAGPAKLQIGSEFSETLAFKKSYGLTNGVTGGIRGDLQVRSIQWNNFAQASVALPWTLTGIAGASLNWVRYDIADRLANSANPTHLNASGKKTFDPVITPRVALQKAFTPEIMAYAQLSQGYTAPASGSVVIPQIGQVNTNLEPERGTLIEVGSKGVVMGITYEAALFNLHVDDKLTPHTVVDPGTGTVLYTETVNAGSQDDRGIELAASYGLLRNVSIVDSLRVFGAFTYSAFTYDGFKNNANNNAGTIDYSGKDVVGVPKHAWNAGFDLLTTFGVYANASFQNVGAMPLTFDGAHRAKGYNLLDAKLGYHRALPAGFALDGSIGARNLTGATYYTMAFLNQSYAGAPPNVYLNGSYSASFYGNLYVSKGF